MAEEQKGAVSEAGAVSQEEPKVEEKPLTEASVAELVAREVAKASDHFQSIADKTIAIANKEARDARRKVEATEASSQAMKQQFLRLNPRAKQQLDLASSQARLQYYDSKEREEAQRREQEAFTSQFYGNLKEDIVNRGIDPADKRIDWAEGVNAFEAQKRVLASVAKIEKEDKVGWQKGLEQSIKDQFANLSKQAGLDSVASTVSKPTNTSGLEDIVGGKNPREAKLALDKFIKGG